MRKSLKFDFKNGIQKSGQTDLKKMATTQLSPKANQNEWLEQKNHSRTY